MRPLPHSPERTTGQSELSADLKERVTGYRAPSPVTSGTSTGRHVHCTYREVATASNCGNKKTTTLRKEFYFDE